MLVVLLVERDVVVILKIYKIAKPNFSEPRDRSTLTHVWPSNLYLCNTLVTHTLTNEYDKVFFKSP